MISMEFEIICGLENGYGWFKIAAWIISCIWELHEI